VLVMLVYVQYGNPETHSLPVQVLII
jgi:hypothetical protein